MIKTKTFFFLNNFNFSLHFFYYIQSQILKITMKIIKLQNIRLNKQVKQFKTEEKRRKETFLK